jgi:RimJ/RimL family protein N-acetyltransferase
MKAMYLQGRRVRLRQYRIDDFESLLTLSSDPAVMRYLTNGKPSSRQDVEAGIERTLHLQRQFGGRLGLFVAELLKSGEFMGWFFLRPDGADPENARVLELGYRLRKEFWGKGYATEVSRDLIRKAFEELGADCVFAQAHELNRASRRVMEKIGLRFVREFIDRSYRRRRSAVLYRLSRSDWETSHPPTPRSARARTRNPRRRPRTKA